MHFIECCTHRFAAPTATSVRTDVVPVFGRVVSRAHETIIERLIKCLDRSANGCLSVVAQCRARQHEEQTNDDDADRLHGDLPLSPPIIHRQPLSWRKIAIALKTGDRLATGWFVGNPSLPGYGRVARHPPATNEA